MAKISHKSTLGTSVKKAHAQWTKRLKELERKTPTRKARFTTVSDMDLPLLATPLDCHYNPADFLKNIGFPGEYPFTRGVYHNMYRGKLWTMRQFAGFASAQDTNKRFKLLLEHGQTGLSTAFDMPTLMGYDADSPRGKGEVGKYLGIDDLKDARIRGFLNDEDLVKIGSNFMDYTQFGYNALELPTAFSNEYGSVILQFKSFGYRQTKFLINEVKLGNPRAIRNLAIITLIYPPLGATQEVLKRIVTGKALEEGLVDEDKTLLGIYFEGIMNTGVLSLVGDTILAGSYGRGLQTIVGPTGTAVGTAVDVVGKAILDPDIARTADDLAKLTTSQLGGGGRGIYNLGKWLWD